MFSLPDRLRPWHGLLTAVFCFVAGAAVRDLDTTAGLGPEAIYVPVAQGLFAVLVFQFTVGSVWGYVVEYRKHGGGWTDNTLLASVALAVLAGLAGTAVWLTGPGGRTTDPQALAVSALGSFLWASFWGFVLSVVVVNLAAQLMKGYSDAADGGDGATDSDDTVDAADSDTQYRKRGDGRASEPERDRAQ